MFWLKQNKTLFFLLILLVLFSIPAIFSLFRPGFFQSDDGEWMIIRFSAFHQALADGLFPVRWLGRLNHEYGYPVANFLYPGFMYLAEIPKIIGFSFVNSIKLILGLSMITSAIFTYLWLAKIFSKWPAFVGSLFYLYAPYHLFDFYKRGSVGEVLALAVVPFVLWMIERKNLVWIAVGIAGLILSHNTLALLLLPILVIYGLIRKLSTFNFQLSTLILGLGLSAFFWIPAIFDLQYTVFYQTVISEWSKYFVNQELVGISLSVVFAATFILILTGIIRIDKHRLTVLFFIIGVVSLFFATQISAPLWNFLPVSFVQFPFRLLSVTILSASFLAACLLSLLPIRLKITGGIIILLLTLISAKPFLTPLEFFNKSEGFYATNEATTTVQNEYMPRWVKVLPSERPQKKVEIINGEGTIDNLKIKDNKVELLSNMNRDGVIRLNIIYFPGWRGFIDGEETTISYINDKGVIEINVPKDKHTVRFSFGETSTRLISDIIALASFIVLLILIFKKKYEIS